MVDHAQALSRAGDRASITAPRVGQPGSRRLSAIAARSRSAVSIELALHGTNHSPDNIYIHLPEHDTLMLVDTVNPGWAPVYLSNLTEDIPGYIEAPATSGARRNPPPPRAR
jgi:hypothetical protein